MWHSVSLSGLGWGPLRRSAGAEVFVCGYTPCFVERCRVVEQSSGAIGAPKSPAETQISVLAQRRGGWW